MQREGGDDGDGKKRSGKSSVSTKRSRAAAIHNQSERVRSLSASFHIPKWKKYIYKNASISFFLNHEIILRNLARLWKDSYFIMLFL